MADGGTFAFPIIEENKQTGLGPTFGDWFQLGEFRRFSVLEISDNGRGMPALVGDPVGVVLEMRRGCVTCMSCC